MSSAVSEAINPCIFPQLSSHRHQMKPLLRLATLVSLRIICQYFIRDQRAICTWCSLLVCSVPHLQSLLSLRKQQAVACLAFSCDWLAHKLQKICAAIKYQPTTAGAVDNKSPSLSGRVKSPNKARDSEGRASGASAEGTVAPVQKLRQMARKLSQLADDSLICLRLEVSLR